MKKITLAALPFFLALFFFPSVSFSAELEAPQTMARKLQRGFLNIALSPMELVHEVSMDKNKDRVIPTFVPGLGRGSVYMAGRVLTGVYELATFPIPIPFRYEPVVYPEFLWEHFKGEESL